jgi:hypothetical protein
MESMGAIFMCGGVPYVKVELWESRWESAPGLFG